MRYEIQTNSKSKIKSVGGYSGASNESNYNWVSKNILSRKDLNRFTLKTVATTPPVHQKLV